MRGEAPKLLKEVDKKIGEISDKRKKIKNIPPPPTPIKWYREAKSMLEDMEESARNLRLELANIDPNLSPDQKLAKRLGAIDDKYKKLREEADKYYKNNPRLEAKLSKERVNNAIELARVAALNLEKQKERNRLDEEARKILEELNALRKEAIKLNTEISDSIKDLGLLDIEKKLASIEKARRGNLEKINEIYNEIIKKNEW